MENFHLLGLSEVILNRLESINYSTPTPVQAQTIPVAIEGLDVLVTAQTGTGKTAAYVIPLIAKLLESDKNSALILTPTREIAIQVANFVTKLLDRKSGIKTALIIGGDSMGGQLNQLRMKPRIIIGTPGRINDHLDRESINFSKTNLVVLDEVDRMLDMGFSLQLEEIFKYLPEQRQTLMFSATLPQNIQKIAATYLISPKRIAIGSTISAAETVKQEVIYTSEEDKYDNLIKQIELREGAIIVFVKTKFGTEKLANRLKEAGHMVDAIHGDLRQRNRERVIRHFRSKKNRILVATDVAARGLDISHVECVINHDLPQCEEDFIHRIGRTGRAGSEGVAVSLVSPVDHVKWRNINKMMNIEIELETKKSDRRSKGSRSSDRRGKFSSSNRERSFGRDKERRNSAPVNKFERENRTERSVDFERGSRSERPSEFSRGNRSERRSTSFDRGNRSEKPVFAEKRDFKKSASTRQDEGFNSKKRFGGRDIFGSSEKSDSKSRFSSNGKFESRSKDGKRFEGSKPKFGDSKSAKFGKSGRSSGTSKPKFGNNSPRKNFA